MGLDPIGFHCSSYVCHLGRGGVVGTQDYGTYSGVLGYSAE